MLTTLEIKTVVCFALSRADFFDHFFMLGNKNGLVLFSPNGLKCFCEASVFQSASYQKILN